MRITSSVSNHAALAEQDLLLGTEPGYPYERNSGTVEMQHIYFLSAINFSLFLSTTCDTFQKVVSRQFYIWIQRVHDLPSGPSI